MSETEEEWVEKAPKKRGLPRWIWFTCGCGSLLALLGAGGLMFFSWRIFEKGTDPEVQ